MKELNLLIAFYRRNEAIRFCYFIITSFVSSITVFCSCLLILRFISFKMDTYRVGVENIMLKYFVAQIEISQLTILLTIYIIC